MNFTRFCVRAVVIVEFALFLIPVFNAFAEMFTDRKSDTLKAFDFVTEAGLVLGVGLIAQGMLERM